MLYFYVAFLQVQASDIQAYGEAYVNITVKKPVRVNIAPVAIVTPVDQEITLPNDGTILDGSGKALFIGLQQNLFSF